MADAAGKDDYRGLDVGTSRIVLARPNGERPTYNVQLNAFIALLLRQDDREDAGGRGHLSPV